MAQKQWANLDYRKNITMIGVVRNKGDKQIMAMGTYAEQDADHAEIAFAAHKEFNLKRH